MNDEEPVSAKGLPRADKLPTEILDPILVVNVEGTGPPHGAALGRMGEQVATVPLRLVQRQEKEKVLFNAVSQAPQRANCAKVCTGSYLRFAPSRCE